MSSTIEWVVSNIGGGAKHHIATLSKLIPVVVVMEADNGLSKVVTPTENADKEPYRTLDQAKADALLRGLDSLKAVRAKIEDADRVTRRSVHALIDCAPLKICTCTGNCRGVASLGDGWLCGMTACHRCTSRPQVPGETMCRRCLLIADRPKAAE